MKEYLEEVFDIEEHDGFTFMPLDTDIYATEIKAFNYTTKGEEIPGNSIGKKYHVVLYRETEEGQISHQDYFTSILGDPAYYGARLIENGWFGIIGKMTTTSDEFIKPLYDMLMEKEEEQRKLQAS